MSDSRSSRTLNELLERRNLTVSGLAHATSVTNAYVYHVASGRKLPSAGWIDLVASTLQLSGQEKSRLLNSAVEDLAEQRYGVKLDLTKE